jgi:hypothetical protein
VQGDLRRFQSLSAVARLSRDKRLFCHGQGYDVVERLLMRYDESMSLMAPLNIGLHPSIVTPLFLTTISCFSYLKQSAALR